MSRLTKYFADGDEYGYKLCYGGCESCDGVLCGNALEMIKKLAHYEDLEEQGRLIELPCKVGDTVYKLWYKPCHNGEDHPDSYSCCGCEDECDLERTIFEFTIPSIDWILQHLHVFGDYVWFLTKEDAEARLEKLKGV